MAFSPDLAGLLVASEEDVLTKTGCGADEANALLEAMKGVTNR
jgi:hypothetical protein